MNDVPIFRRGLRKRSRGEKSVFRLCTFYITIIPAPIEEIMAVCLIHEEQLLKLLARNCIWKMKPTRHKSSQFSASWTDTQSLTHIFLHDFTFPSGSIFWKWCQMWIWGQPNFFFLCMYVSLSSLLNTETRTWLQNIWLVEASVMYANKQSFCFTVCL